MFNGENIGLMPNDNKSCYVNIDSYENRVPSGVIYNNFYKKNRRFTGTIELLEIMEKMLDEFMPNSADTMRLFCEKSTENRLEEADVSISHSGLLATFRIDVIFRQRSSWQGVMRWIEKDKEECFRSVLEMIKLLDSAVVGSTETEKSSK